MRTIKKLVLAGLACLTVSAVHAATPKGPGTFVNESGLSTSKNYPLSLNSYMIDQLAVQVSWSTPTVAATTFTDGSVSTFTVTVTSSPSQGFTPATTICINGICLADGAQWNHDTATAQSSGTACAIAAAINASTSLNTVVVSTCVAKSGTGSIVATTSTAVGFNYATYSSSQSAFTLSPYTSSSTVTGLGFGSMVGGTTSSYLINTTVISATNGYSPLGKNPMVGIPLLYAVGTGAQAIGGLTTGTTYYGIPVSVGSFGLSTTSTGAVAGFAKLPSVSTMTAGVADGTFILLTTTQTKTTADTWTLTASSYSATTTLTWQVSNDGVNWTNSTSTGAVVLTPATPAVPLAYDFGTFNFGFLQANVVRSGGSLGWSGPEQVLITINGKNSGL